MVARARADEGADAGAVGDGEDEHQGAAGGGVEDVAGGVAVGVGGGGVDVGDRRGEQGDLAAIVI
jgi:hypothetical protein